MAPHRAVDVLERGLALGVADEDVSVLADVVEEQVVADDFVGAVAGGVVDDHCEVVGVVLREDGVEVVLESKLGVVVVAGHHEAHWQLKRKGREVVHALDAHILAFLLIHLELVQIAIGLDCKLGQPQTLKLVRIISQQLDSSHIEAKSFLAHQVRSVEHVLDAA